MQTLPPVFGAFSYGAATATGGTAFTNLLLPNTIGVSPNSPQNLYQIGTTPIPGANTLLRSAAWYKQAEPAVGVIHITDLVYTTGNTAHLVSLLEPLNWTYTTAVSAQNTNTITIAYDPGAYSTNFAYGAGGVTVGSTADNLIANTDYVAFQLADGSWFSSKVSAYNTSTKVLTLVTALPAPTLNTSGGVLANTPVFWFGQAGDTDPVSGKAQWQTTTVVNTNRQQLMASNVLGGFATERAGDPVLFYSPNNTAAGTADYIAGYFGKK
jgi:hypothetical protein